MHQLRLSIKRTYIREVNVEIRSIAERRHVQYSTLVFDHPQANLQQYHINLLFYQLTSHHSYP